MGKLKKIMGLVLLFLGSVSAQADSFVPSAVLFETAAGQILGALNGAVPGNPYSVLGPFQVKVKGSGTPTSPSCTFDNLLTVTGTLTSGGYLCQVPPQAAVNGMHSISAPAVNVNYLLSGQPPYKPTLSCTTSKCVQDALNGAPVGTAVLPTVLDFGGSQIQNCGLISLDAVKPYVTVKNLTLTGSATDCTIGNSFAHAVTNNVVLDNLTVINGTHSTTLPSCSVTGSASVILYGINNSVQNSTITGGSGSGVFLGGSNNAVKNTLFTKVNTYNGTSMTDCSGVLVRGYHELVAFNTFNQCNGSCIHIAPSSASSPNIASNLTANDSIWGNKIINGIYKSFEGTIYPGDGGPLYAGWADGKNTNIQYNQILGLNPLNFGFAGYGSGLYLDNNTSNFVVKNNFVDVPSSSPPLKLNPQTYQDNPGGILKSQNRTAQNNSWTGNTPIAASMKIIDGTGQKVMATSPDAVCPLTCNNKTNMPSTPPFTAGVGSGSTLPAPTFLSN